MKRLLAVAVICTSLGLFLGFYLWGVPPTAIAAIGDGTGGVTVECTTKNGDVNADGRVDLSDATTILGHLFLGNPTKLVGLCVPPDLTARIQELETQLADCRAGNCPGSRAGLPDTGQAKCYDASGTMIPCGSATCAGQDGHYATGCPNDANRFTDNLDGTVTDHCTGLMWQKETADVNGDGKIDAADALPWCAALAYCENLSFGGGLAAWDDWRLPNVRELQSIVDYGRSYPAPAIDPVFGALSSLYWSSTSLAIIPGGAWGVYFSLGSVFYGNGKDSVFHVRAVRNAP